MSPLSWVFPDGSSSSPDELAGIGAVVPPGGLSTRLLRGLTVGAHIDYMGEIIRRLHATPKGIPSVDRFKQLSAPLLSPRATAAARRPNGGGQPGRKPLSDLVLAEAAAAYVAARKPGDTLVVAARRFRMSEARMRDLVFRARRRTLLLISA